MAHSTVGKHEVDTPITQWTSEKGEFEHHAIAGLIEIKINRGQYSQELIHAILESFRTILEQHSLQPR